ncbi:hypothetical protein OH76DRAFT_1007231 [Lentinus brumalis]|uniref:Uncharacterized protein n=1 Tax=Lentinus brumalis TaxID=2498619 RepID=A0A371CY88_9APHY|nr:hypothetical protein OH76DRAFT_1007231 [Polyporus brumalis]
MLCADSVDVNDMTMENAFKGTISTFRNVSHIFGSLRPLPFYCSFGPVNSVEFQVSREAPRNIEHEACEQVSVCYNLITPPDYTAPGDSRDTR